MARLIYSQSNEVDVPLCLPAFAPLLTSLASDSSSHSRVRPSFSPFVTNCLSVAIVAALSWLVWDTLIHLDIEVYGITHNFAIQVLMPSRRSSIYGGMDPIHKRDKVSCLSSLSQEASVVDETMLSLYSVSNIARVRVCEITYNA